MPAEHTPLLLIHERDNVAVLTRSLPKGAAVEIAGRTMTLPDALGLGHKLAAKDIAKGEKIRKYGLPIGSALEDISAGEHVHLHNMASDYLPTYTHEEGRRFGEDKA